VDARENETSMLPPIELDTHVPCAPDVAFDYFTRDIGRWWPLAIYSCSESRAAGVSFDGRVGGKLTEVDVDGKAYVWGTVLAWERGRKVSFTWHPGKSPDTPLTVAITFDVAGTGTRVRLVHSGWDRLGAIAGEAREGYAKGWPTVFAQLYKGYCDEAASRADTT
jgi:uncharacterized protein YndB with AHSA1/START domain